MEIKTYYLLIDLSFTPFKMNPDHMRNSSLTVFWIKVNSVSTKLKRAAFVIIDSDGKLCKCVWPPKVMRVSSIMISILNKTSIDANAWDWNSLLKLQTVREQIKKNYGNREIYRKRMSLLPNVQNTLYNIC
jgi:hypothetical protein